MKLKNEINCKNWFNLLCQFECGKLQESLIAPLFQYLINHGIVWNLQGSHGATADLLIHDGLCVLGEIPYRTAYGMSYPSRHELPNNEPGSRGYQKIMGLDLIEMCYRRFPRRVKKRLKKEGSFQISRTLTGYILLK